MANYPFCTIDPNKGIVPVPDRRLGKISEILNIKQPIYTRIEFIDVAGLVKGASKGEGLGNRFLDHVRSVDAIVHVARCFADPDIVHVTGDVDPFRDIEIINTELMLADLNVLEKGRTREYKLAQIGDKKAKIRQDIIENAINGLNSGLALRSMSMTEEARGIISGLGCITDKPVLYLANTDETSASAQYASKVKVYADEHASGFLAFYGKMEEELSHLEENEKKEFLDSMGFDASGLDRLISSSYAMLDLITYYTVETKLQAWTLKTGTTAQNAAGKIHSDFERGFIRAEVYKFNDLVIHGSETVLKEKGLIHSEGKEYHVRDGDIIRYLFNV
jgi:hypothetical protein